MSSVFDPHSAFARSIYGLSMSALIVTAVILALVAAPVLVACWRFRARERKVCSSAKLWAILKLEISYTLTPLVVLGVILVFTNTHNAKLGLFRMVRKIVTIIAVVL